MWRALCVCVCSSSGPYSQPLLILRTNLAKGPSEAPVFPEGVAAPAPGVYVFVYVFVFAYVAVFA